MINITELQLSSRGDTPPLSIETPPGVGGNLAAGAILGFTHHPPERLE